MTALPQEIEHLDFPTYQPVRYVKMTPKVVEEKEPQKTCGIARAHPFDSELLACGRPGYVEVDLEKPCGHTDTTVVCKGCWTKFSNDGHWTCRVLVNGGKCSARITMEHVKAWRRL